MQHTKELWALIDKPQESAHLWKMKTRGPEGSEGHYFPNAHSKRLIYLFN
jgi:hypothetical protein